MAVMATLKPYWANNMSLIPFADLFTEVLRIVFPDKTAITKADIELKKDLINIELQKLIAQKELSLGNLKINEAEAANPNRKWITWRELLGYGLAFAVLWDKVILPFCLFLFLASGHPLDVNVLPKLQMEDVLYLLGAMLGIQVMPGAWQGTKDMINKARGK